MVFSILSDVTCRTCILPVILDRMKIQKFEIYPCTDLYLRLRCTTSYVTPVAMLPYAILGLLTGAPWAGKAGTWWGFLAYCTACITADIVIVVASHLFAPTSRKGCWAAAGQLAVQPRAH